MIEIIQYAFMQNALAAAVLASVACGIIGTYVVIKRIVSISGGIAHSAFGGVGLGFLLGINPVIVAIPFSILCALCIGIISRKKEISEDTSIGILWTSGMALGILFVGLSPRYAADLFSYLFGSILTVPQSDLATMLVLDFLIILVVFMFYKEFLAISFDEEYSRVVGVPARPMYLLLLCLVALSVVIMMRVVGIILVIALLTIPAVICRQFTYDIKKMMVLSVFIGIVLNAVGLYLSYIFDLPAGATIVLVMVAGFVLSALLQKIYLKALQYRCQAGAASKNEHRHKNGSERDFD